MEIKNEALRSLYESLVADDWSVWSIRIDALFKKCDDELEKEKEKLHKKCTYFENLSSERLKATEELHQQLDTDEKEREARREESIRNIREGYKTECDLKELRQKYDALDRSHKRLADIRNRLAKENEELKAKMDNDLVFYRIRQLEETNARLIKEKQGLMQKLGETYTELSKAFDKLSGEKRKLNARTDCLRSEVEWYRKHYKEKSDKIQELKSRLNSMYGVESIKEPQNNVRKNCYDQGQTDLWVKLQDVKDMQPNEFDVECECLSDVLDMDLEDFLDAYEKWWEEKENEETDRMRNWLSDFCVGKVCGECPLGSDEFKCGRGYSFKRRDRFDLRIIPDEDIKRYYEKARGCGRFPWSDKKTSEEVPCSFNWKLDGTEYTIETSIPKSDYDNIVKIISGKE